MIDVDIYILKNNVQTFKPFEEIGYLSLFNAWIRCTSCHATTKDTINVFLLQLKAPPCTWRIEELMMMEHVKNLIMI